MLQNILGELEPAKRPTAEYRILPPLPQELLQGDKQNDELPPDLIYKPLKYSGIANVEKASLYHFSLDCGTLSADF